MSSNLTASDFIDSNGRKPDNCYDLCYVVTMGDALQHKEDRLGDKWGTANNTLRKSVMFMLVKKCQMDDCYRCGKKIRQLNDFTVDHKQNWLYATNPAKTFFDVSNIAFSHKGCNYAKRGSTRRLSKTSGYRGVHYHPNSGVKNKPWRAVLSRSKKPPIYFGYYKTAKQAASAYDNGVKKMLGICSLTNKKMGLI